MSQQIGSAAPFKEVCVIGLGYIGLPTAAFIASKRIPVHGVDVDRDHVDKISNGEVPFHEPGFEPLLQHVLKGGYLSVGGSPDFADVFILAVPTPINKNFSVDLSYIESASRSIAPYLRGGVLVVLESTAPPGTTERMAESLVEQRPDLTLEPGKDNSLLVAHCPERVLPGRTMVEIESNDRIIGGLTEDASYAAMKLYSSFCEGQLLLTDARTAELAKLTENAFRDVNIAFANELSLVCEHLGINVWELIELANHHPRVNILQPGPGVGGHCIAIDPWFIVSSAPSQARLIRAARDVNDSKPKHVLNKVIRTIKAQRISTVAALGISFKADIDDLRESPSLDIVKRLSDELPTSVIKVVEPNIGRLPTVLENRKNVDLESLESAIDTAELILILVDHTLFKNFDRSKLEDKLIIDTKGIWN